MAEIISERSAGDKGSTEKDYQLVLAAFHRLTGNFENSAGRWDTLEDIITLRASFLIDRVLSGLRIDFGKALSLIRNHNNFTSERERKERDIILAAIGNLVDFAAAQEYTMLEELPDELDTQEAGAYDSLCETYNLRYAARENEDVFYAARMAAWFLNLPEETPVTFMTQGDERVRPWHMSHEGLTFPKSAFPPELIPPIEWGCRCYLLTNGFASVMDSGDKRAYDIQVNPVFRESLARGGRIFSEAHPYFKTVLPAEVKKIAERIKQKFN